MLIKNELKNLPLTPGPKAKKKCSFTAGVATFTPKRCGEILAIDVYEKSKLQFRFFTDGKNYITLVGQLDMGLEPGSWTRRNPFLSFPALHTGVAIKSGAEDIVRSVIKAASISTRDDSFIINTVCSFISDIAWEKKRKTYLPILRETQANALEIDVISAAGRWVPEDTVRQLCARNMDSYTLHTLSETTQYNSLGRVLRYLNKQYAQAAGALKKRKKDYFVTLYRDYLNCASELKSDMKKRGVLEPKDLKFQHDLLTARVNEQKEEERQKELNKPIDQSVYWWAQAYANQDFTVVYPQKRLDFLTEGQCLNHCVGNYGYYERHLKGQQMVFFIRRTGQPNKPYFTAEIDVESGRIRQLYGFGDCSAPKEVRAFVEGFVKSVCRWRNVQTLAS